MMQTQLPLTEKKTSPLLLLALVGLMLSTLFSAYYPSLANAAQQGPTTITATGVLVGPIDDGDEDPTPEFRLTDEEAGRTLNLTSGFVNLEDYAGQRVTIEGVRVPGIDPNAYNVTTIVPVEEGEGPTSPGDKATLSFELTVEGEPPEDAEFLGFTSIESLMTTPLIDTDADGTYTGSMTVPATSGGQGGPPEPLSLPVRIVQGPPTGTTANGPEYRIIKDFGQVKIDGDKTFSASVSFEGDDGGSGGQEVSATGMIEKTEATSYQYGTHTINDSSSGAPIYALESDVVDLDDYDGSVTIYGTLVAGYEKGLDGGPPLVEVSRVGTPPPPGGGETHGVRGTITSISGSVLLVEEVPSAEESGDKGYFTVTDETEIARLEGDIRIPASLEDLEVGQQVQAEYAGAVAQSYPTQGEAESIVILEELACMLPEGCEDPGDGEETVTATFELTVECQPPAGTGFSASIGQGPVATGALLDQDGDGVYTVSLPVEQGTEQEVLIERLDPINDEPQAPLTASTLKDFGSVKFDEDETFSASVSFCDDGSDDGGTDNGDGSDNNGGSDNDSGSDNGGSNNVGSGSSSGGSSGGGGVVASGIRGLLPSTGGGMALTLLGAGVLMTGGGLFIRRIFR